MRVGLFINTQFPEGVNLAERIPEMVAQVRAARDAGFVSLDLMQKSDDIRNSLKRHKSIFG